MNQGTSSESGAFFLLYFKPIPIDTGDMRPSYFVPDSDSSLLSDHSRDGSVYLAGGRDLPDDIHWRCLCHLCCRYLSEGMSWEDIPCLLDVDDESSLSEYFFSYTGMCPQSYGEWCRRRRGI